MARILVVDDEESIRFTFESFLMERGHEVHTCSNYAAALALSLEIDFDLIYSDIILGGRTGIDLLRELSRTKKNCPVVMITGFPDVSTAAEAVRLGAFEYIQKPVEFETLLSVTSLALVFKKVTDEKEKYRAHLDAIFRSVEDAIITVNEGLRLIEMNQAAQKILGLDRNAIGKEFNSLSPGCNARFLDALRETISKKQSVRAERIECRRHGKPSMIVSLSTYPLIDRKGVFSGAVMVVRDETRLARLEQDLGERGKINNIVGKSEPMKKIYSLIEALADVETTVLITGESGTGKELVAEALHYCGARSQKPLVKVDCSVLSENLLESELFGHVKGAFTGAVCDRIGRFHRANGGTIFLDEIGDISLKVQSTLLRILQEKEFERVGDSTPIKADVRIIAATNKDLLQKVKKGEFREDLLYRIRVVDLYLPPLRDRKEDIHLLVKHSINKFNKKLGKELTAVSSDIEKLFMDYPWPGNVRELEHAIEHAFIFCRQGIITIDHLPSYFKDFLHEALPSGEKTAVAIDEMVRALEQTGWNKAKAARLLGIDRKTIYRNMAKFGIPEDK